MTPLADVLPDIIRMVISGAVAAILVIAFVISMIVVITYGSTLRRW